MNSDYWMKEGTHLCTVEECITGTHDNDTGSKYIRFDLKNEQGQHCNMSFVVSDASIRAIRSFARACGLNAAQVKLLRKADFIGKKVEIDVTLNADGYPVPQQWRKAQSQGNRAEDAEESEYLI